MTPAPDSSQPGPGPRPFHRVLVGWDARPDSETALRAAAAVVGDAEGHVVALAVLPGPIGVPAGQEDGDAPPGLRVSDAFERARAAIADTWPVRMSLEIRAGRHVARSICDYAAEHGFDLLVLGRHGDGRMLHAPRPARARRRGGRARQQSPGPPAQRPVVPDGGR